MTDNAQASAVTAIEPAVAADYDAAVHALLDHLERIASLARSVEETRAEAKRALSAAGLAADAGRALVEQVNGAARQVTTWREGVAAELRGELTSHGVALERAMSTALGDISDKIIGAQRATAGIAEQIGVVSTELGDIRAEQAQQAGDLRIVLSRLETVAGGLVGQIDARANSLDNTLRDVQSRIDARGEATSAALRDLQPGLQRLSERTEAGHRALRRLLYIALAVAGVAAASAVAALVYAIPR